MRKFSNIDEIKKHLSEAEQKLRTDELLSEAECFQLKRDIFNLSEEESRNVQEEEFMEIDELVAEFKEYADKSKECLENMLGVIAKGCVPTENECEKFNGVVAILNQKYNSVYAAAKEQLSVEEMPEEGSSVTDYADAVKNSKTAALKKKLKEMKDILQRFISVKAMADAYSKTLESYQKDARALLDKIAENEVNEVEEIQKQVRGPELFLRAMECENMDSDEALDLLDQLGILDYPARITTGLSRKIFVFGEFPENGDMEASATEEEKTENIEKIIVPENAEKKGIQPEKEGILEKQEAKREDASEKKAVIEKQKVLTGEEEKKETVLAPKREEKPKEEKSGRTEFTKRINRKELFLKEEKDFGILSCDISTSEDRKLSTSVFLNDLRKGNLKVNTNIIKMLETYPVISSELLEMKCGMPANVAGIGLEFLKTKGYLRKYTLLPNGSFYCTSPRLERALEYKDASKQVGVKQHSAANSSEFIEDKASSASVRLALLNMIMIHIKDLHAVNAGKTASPEKYLNKNTFILRVIPRDDRPEECELFTGVFWTEDNECDEYIVELKKKISDVKIINKLVIASINYGFAQKIADEIVQEAKGELKHTSVYVYVLNGDEFYDYYGNKKIDLEDIWTSLKKDESVPEADGIEELSASAESEAEDEEEAAADTLKREVGPEAQITEKIKNTQIAEITEILCEFINKKRNYCVSPYVKARMAKDKSLADFYEQVAFAFNDPMRKCIYSVNDVYEIISFKESALSEYMNIAIALRTFFSNQVQYDYNLPALYTTIKESEILNSYSDLRNVLYKLEQFKETQQKGMDAYADYHAKSITHMEESLGKIQKEAESFYESTIKGKKKEDKSQQRFLETKKLLFNPNGELGRCIEGIIGKERDINKDKEHQLEVEKFLREYFIKDGNVISEDTIDEERLRKYIEEFWEKAGYKMPTARRSSDLMGQLRNNITNATKKGIQILAKWFVIVDKLNGKKEDKGSRMYKKQRTPLLKDIEDALNAIYSDIAQSADGKEKAGLEIIWCVLDEINRCIQGTYDEREKRFVYVPFLFTNHIMLDENFNPDLEVFSTEIEELQPEYRILEHASAEYASETERLSEILENREDNYGTARLLVEYMEAMDSKEDIDTYKENIKSSEGYAKETASLKKDQFIGDLELAQSFGQIENSNSKEDKKEKILQIVNVWYEAMQESSNYGFFGHVTESFLANIRKESKHREIDLLEQVTRFRETSVNGLSEEIKETRIKKILAAINQQNYTVAEDHLAHAEQLEGDGDDPIEENILKDFLDNYDDYYKVVSQNNTNLAALISKNAHNKESRGGKKLAENWLPGGSQLGKERLVDLLKGFGFRVDSASVQTQEKILGRFENYYVKTISAKGGKRGGYMHPIAAFGSGASQEGFRVVCLNGKYDAAGLVDVKKQIGNSRHTIVLLDSAMNITQRRTLARKIRQEQGDKVFVVIDRTVVMYLVKNYDEIKINRMLISLIMPFGYYQPYVWESAQVMPPEIFMGRKRELEQIESASGVNIVYGGRQLGKSALLKMAKSDIDFDENGDRAVLIDIKGLNYDEVAKKIGNELYDAGVLTEDVNTTDWSELVRVIKKRLQSEKDRIPYLLLLLDEADAFIESCKRIGYRPFDALKELQGIGTGRFKFVVAGLRNVVRFQKEAALGNNSVLTHLQSMTVKPFQSAEARELMEIPLHYLGLEFPKENENLTGLILASTNYFPGLIQMYCAKLLLAMRKKDYAGYDEADTPIYEVGEEHIRKVLADPEFMDQIREKFFITLKLDEDNYYYLIALLMAYLYYANSNNEGYSAANIKEAGKEFCIGKIANLELEKLEAFMEEMKELNVFRRTKERHYLFTRYTFFQMMGTSVEVDDKLETYMEA